MSVSISESRIEDAIFNNETATVAKILEEFGVSKDALLFSDESKEVVTMMLRFASIRELAKKLSSDLTRELIDRTAMAVDIFSFLQLILDGLEISFSDFGIIPKDVLEAIEENEYYSDIDKKIEELSIGAFLALLDFIANETQILSIRFSVPIIRKLNSCSIVPKHMILACMAMNLKPTINEKVDDIISDFIDAINSIDS